MPISLMMTMLTKGETGSEILQILDAITSDNQDSVVESTGPQPTDQWIDF